jgi:hypothetical protein
MTEGGLGDDRGQPQPLHGRGERSATRRFVRDIDSNPGYRHPDDRGDGMPAFRSRKAIDQ